MKVVFMEQKTKEYIKNSLDWIEISINALEYEILHGVKKELKKLRKIHKEVISKL